MEAELIYVLMQETGAYSTGDYRQCPVKAYREKLAAELEKDRCNKLVKHLKDTCPSVLYFDKEEKGEFDELSFKDMDELWEIHYKVACHHWAEHGLSYGSDPRYRIISITLI